MPITVPQLDDRTFEQLFAEAKARIPVHTPEWTNFNDSDPGITILQLFAFMTENLLYRSNRIPEASRRKFLTLLGVPLQPATPARGLVVFRNERGPIQAWPLEAGVELRAGKVPFRTRTAVCILPVTAEVFYKRPVGELDPNTAAQYRLLYESFLERDADQLQFYRSTPLAAPEIGKPLPELDLADSQNGVVDRSLWVALVGPRNVSPDAVAAAIAGQTLTLGIYPALRCQGLKLEPVAFEPQVVADPGLVFEIAAPEPSSTPGVGVGPARYVRLEVEYAENVLEQPGIVRLTLPPYEQLLVWDLDPQEEGSGDYPPLVEDRGLASRIVTWIRIRLPKAGKDAAASQQARLCWVGANAARVLQAVPVTHERLGVGTGAPDQSFKVANTPVIVGPLAPRKLPVPGEPEDTFVLEVQNADGGWDNWRRTDDLYAAGPADPVYTLDPESGLVAFGDGLRGLRPPLGRAIRVSYEYGGGPQGLVPIGAINKSPVLPGGFKVENPLPTWGADAGESVADGERNIPRYLKHRDRLVTASDFRDIVLRTPGVEVGRVEVLPLFNPDQGGALQKAWPGAVTVMVIPRHDPVHPDTPEPDRLFLDAVCRWLDPRRLVTTEIFVRGPEYVPVWVSVGIVTLPGYQREQVRRDVRTALRNYLSPLIGGPRAAAAADLDPICPDNGAEDAACPPARGVGWPLATEVRRQDLEAMATRVPGVRYVTGVKLGVNTPGSATLTDVATVPLSGLQLPRLVGISVAEGAAEDLASLLGQQPAVSPNLVPVPVLPQAC
ncbi:MAG: putative baseplate assembly protein [Caldilineales bacterium]|nr:putative baseplate assembly protein [Caldilineales bacterium]MDW8318316.1 putative baseplate assembly protein [Anaerolineae bacterium]